MLRRRQLLACALAPWAGSAAAAAGAAVAGNVEPPLPAAPIALTDAEGRATTLREAVSGAPTAVQLMFTGCSAVCPTLGLLFATLAARPRLVSAHFLSLSIDALGDDPARLRQWQARFGAHPSWRAAVPPPDQVERLSEFLRGKAVRPGTHGSQVFVFDAAGRLVHRSADPAGAAEVEAALAHAAGAAPA